MTEGQTSGVFRGRDGQKGLSWVSFFLPILSFRLDRRVRPKEIYRPDLNNCAKRHTPVLSCLFLGRFRHLGRPFRN